ncbi:SPFH domain-containing protein [Chloroflexus aggregans]|uniref:Band 7 domain-containing protein n=1 Tax=Chloroflexus aggregans (strain MD-66 / DSM 9485) TaxID=326427 RepID=B8G743_CHLAD|nr:SPFH domain-containing protein [Chloroflexus aggregans]ACL24000.1 hypothetical protein Cagg_1087 [Chloroflexus aggregans DSM 9485]
MKTTKKFFGIFPKILFFPVLFVIMALPQLLSKSPSPFFRSIKQLLESQSIFTILLIVFGILLLIVLIAVVAVLTDDEWKENMKRKVDTTEAVKRERGGNGIYTDPIPFIWIFSVLTYVYVETGKECAIVDGERIIETKQWITKSFFHDAVIRYVLLEPPPLIMTIENVRTQDDLYLTADISVTYRVRDPLAIIKKADPLKILQEHVKSQCTNLIGRLDYYTIADKKAKYENEICAAIQRESILPLFEITSVHLEMKLAVDPRNVEKIEELKRQQKEKDLLVEDRQKERDHAREIDKAKIGAGLTIIKETAEIAKGRSESTKEYIDSLGPRAILSMIGTPYHNLESAPNLPMLTEATERSRYEREKPELDNLQENGVIKNYESRWSKDGNFCGVVIEVDDGQIHILSPSYPDIAPTIQFISRSGQTYEWPIEKWNANMTIVHVITIALSKIKLLQ